MRMLYDHDNLAEGEQQASPMEAAYTNLMKLC